MLWLKVPLEAERIREVFCLAIDSGHSINAELSYELQHPKWKGAFAQLVCWLSFIHPVDLVHNGTINQIPYLDLNFFTKPNSFTARINQIPYLRPKWSHSLPGHRKKIQKIKTKKNIFFKKTYALH